MEKSRGPELQPRKAARLENRDHSRHETFCPGLESGRVVTSAGDRRVRALLQSSPINPAVDLADPNGPRRACADECVRKAGRVRSDDVRVDLHWAPAHIRG